MYFPTIIISAFVLQTLSLPLHVPPAPDRDTTAARDLAGLLDGNDPPPNWSTESLEDTPRWGPGSTLDVTIGGFTTAIRTKGTTTTPGGPEPTTHILAESTMILPTMSVAPTSTSTSDKLAATYTPPITGVGSTREAPSTPPAEAAEWKVIGIAVISVSLVATVILATTFFDSWWGFLRDLVLGRPKRNGFEDMTPDWETRSWEIKIANEDGHRYPTSSQANPLFLGKSPDQRTRDLLTSYLPPLPSPNHYSAPSVATPEIMYLPENDPHPLDPLIRRPRKPCN